MTVPAGKVEGGGSCSPGRSLGRMTLSRGRMREVALARGKVPGEGGLLAGEVGEEPYKGDQRHHAEHPPG